MIKRLNACGPKGKETKCLKGNNSAILVTLLLMLGEKSIYPTSWRRQVSRPLWTCKRSAWKSQSKS